MLTGLPPGRPVRVLHVVDGLAGGGSERLVWETVRLAAPERVRQRVVTVIPDCSAFVYSAPLRELGAYGQGPPAATGAGKGSGVRGRLGGVGDRLLLAARRRFPLHSSSLRTQLVGWALAGPALWRLWREYRRFRPDVIHGHLFYGFATALALSRLTRRPLVCTVSAHRQQIADAGYGWIHALYRRAHPWVARFMIDAAYRDELIGIGIPPEKVGCFRGTIDLTPIQAALRERERHRSEVRQELGIPPAALLALSVGRLHPSKGHVEAIEALKLAVADFPDLHWVALGEGAERAALEGRARALGVGGHAHLVGFQEDQYRFYAAADLFVRAYRMEGDNLSSQIAMAAGLPVAGFETAWQTDLVPQVGHGRLAPRGDAADLAAAMRQILSLPDRGRAIGERGAAYAREHLGIETSIRDLDSLYAELAGGACAGGHPAVNDRSASRKEP